MVAGASWRGTGRPWLREKVQERRGRRDASTTTKREIDEVSCSSWLNGGRIGDDPRIQEKQ